jgi:hypothetical protein
MLFCIKRREVEKLLLIFPSYATVNQKIIIPHPSSIVYQAIGLIVPTDLYRPG